MTFLPKNTCDVRKVEFARALRLCNSVLEPLSFAVPRVKTTLFQDDIFPPTLATWQASMEACDWLAGGSVLQPLLDLCPPDMNKLSDGDRPHPKHQQTGDSICPVQEQVYC